MMSTGFILPVWHGLSVHYRLKNEFFTEDFLTDGSLVAACPRPSPRFAYSSAETVVLPKTQRRCRRKFATATITLTTSQVEDGEYPIRSTKTPSDATVAIKHNAWVARNLTKCRPEESNVQNVQLRLSM